MEVTISSTMKKIHELVTDDGRFDLLESRDARIYINNMILDVAQRVIGHYNTSIRQLKARSETDPTISNEDIALFAYSFVQYAACDVYFEYCLCISKIFPYNKHEH